MVLFVVVVRDFESAAPHLVLHVGICAGPHCLTAQETMAYLVQPVAPS